VSELQTILERELFPFVEKPMRYIGNELNSIVKDCNHVALRGVLCFPELYDIGMSGFGMQMLYHIVNKNPGWALSRAYQPWGDAEEIMRRKRIPLYCLEYQKPLSGADWIGFSVQYELQYAIVCNMLDLAGIAVYSADRIEGDPVVIAGGPCMGNPEPLAPFIDACVIGDGEESIVSFCETMESNKKCGLSRRRIIEALAAIRGVYVPALYPVNKRGRFFVPDPAKKNIPCHAAKVPMLADEHYPVKHLVPLMEVVHHRLAVEIMRGCTRGCRFCSAGTYYRPVRERDMSSITSTIEKGIEATGWEDVGLLSLSTADYSNFDGLVCAASGFYRLRQVGVALPSTRVDALTPEQLKAFLAASPATSFTIAPEAGSQRLRNVINKDFTGETILSVVRTLLDNNIQTIKLYFMIGLPTETNEDLDAIVTLVNTISDIVWQKSKRRMVNVSVSPFSPKPHTPFQWCGMDSMESLKEKGVSIKARLRVKKNVKVSYREPGMTFLETVLARGDRSVSAVIFGAWKRGAKFDGWEEHFDLSRWNQAAQEADIPLELFAAEIPPDQQLPWDAVVTGVSKEFLRAEREKSLQGITTGDCRKIGCYTCGACETLSPVYSQVPRTQATSGILSSTPVAKHPNDESQEKFVYRVEYAKERPIRFISHKDMVRIVHRAFSAARIPIAYSQGFHPHPRISFGPPLPLGVMGSSEFFDMTTTQPVSFIHQSVSRWFPVGLVIRDSKVLVGKQVSLNESIVAGEYLFESLLQLSKENIVGTILKTLSQSVLILEVTDKEGEKKKRDLRPCIYSLVSGGRPGTFKAVLSMLPANTCRPVELLRCMFGQETTGNFLITRISCLENSAGLFKRIGVLPSYNL
jgi:radical SAM family uncharacterized protein/radical SAM-linked protein